MTVSTSHRNLRRRVHGPTEGGVTSLTPPRFRLTSPRGSVRQCVGVPLRAVSDGGGGRERRDDKLPRRAAEERAEGRPLPTLHRLDPHSRPIVSFVSRRVTTSLVVILLGVSLCYICF